MSSSLRSIFRSLKAEVLSPQYISLFDSARSHHESLVLHNGIGSILRTLGDDRKETYPERDVLIRVLVREQHAETGSFWNSVLFVACYPMLSKLRYQIYGTAVPDDDLDQIIITTFLSTVAKCDPRKNPNQIAAWLKSETQRCVFNSLQSLRAKQKTERPVLVDKFFRKDRPGWPDEKKNKLQGPQNPIDAADAVIALVEYAGNVLNAECFDLVTTTLICERPITAYVDKIAPGLDDNTRHRLYQRIKRRHSRAISRLRAALSDFHCPQIKGELLCTY